MTTRYDLEGLLRLEEWAQSGGTEKERFEFGMWAREVACGTALCLAGKVCADSGVSFLWESGTARKVLDKDGRPHDIQGWAARRLGISATESYVLFSPDRHYGLDERCALEFLSVLITRARKDMDSMTDRETLNWMNEFFRRHDPDGAEDDEKEEGRWP